MVKRDILRYARAVRGIGLVPLDHRVLLCKVRLVGAQINRIGGARRIRREKLKEHQYREGYARS